MIPSLPSILEIPHGRVARGSVRVPGSKSLTQRALVVAALAEGRSSLTGALDSDDSRDLRVALRRLGARTATPTAARLPAGRDARPRRPPRGRAPSPRRPLEPVPERPPDGGAPRP